MPLSPQEEQELQQLVASLPEEELDSVLSELESPQPAQPESRAGEAAIEGFGQTASLGYLPQMQSVAEKGVVDPLVAGLGKLGIGPGAVDERLRRQGIQVPDSSSYVESRDQFRARARGLQEQHPVATLAGQTAGAAASSVIPAGKAAQLGAGAIKGGAASGAVLGALYNPGDVEGQIQPLQAGERLKGAAAGAALGGTLGAAGKMISGPARRSRMVQKLKKGVLGKEIASTQRKAQSAITEKKIAPIAKQVNKALEGKKVDLNPDRLKGISKGLDNYAAKLEKRMQGQRVQLDAKKAQRLKVLLGSRGKYKKGHVYDPSQEAKQKAAGTARSLLKEKLERAAPETAQMNQQMQEAILLRDALKPTKAPVSQFKAAKPGSAQYDVIAQGERMSGVPLNQLSEDVTSASQLLLNPRKLVHPLEMPPEVLRMLRRAGGRGARVAEPFVSTPEAQRGALLNALERLREK